MFLNGEPSHVSEKEPSCCIVGIGVSLVEFGWKKGVSCWWAAIYGGFR